MPRIVTSRGYYQVMASLPLPWIIQDGDLVQDFLILGVLILQELRLTNIMRVFLDNSWRL